MQILTLINGSENNIKEPSEGNVGYDLKAKSITVKGLNIYRSEVKKEVQDSRELEGVSWQSIDYIEYDTGVQYEPAGYEMEPRISGLGERSLPEITYTQNFFGLLFARSSVSKTNLVLANGVGVIDPNYRGTIRARFKYIWSPDEKNINVSKIYNVGDRVAQLVFMPTAFPQIVLTNQLEETERQHGGFGSSGK